MSAAVRPFPSMSSWCAQGNSTEKKLTQTENKSNAIRLFEKQKHPLSSHRFRTGLEAANIRIIH